MSQKQSRILSTDLSFVCLPKTSICCLTRCSSECWSTRLRVPTNLNRWRAICLGRWRSGGRIGFEQVAWFNGGLFNNHDALPLEKDDIALTLVAANLDWAEIDPSIFGTLFERGLDPDKRSQLGAHYTDREKIMMIVEPVIIRPWLTEWKAAKSKISEALDLAAEARQRVPARQADARKVFAAARRAEEAAKKTATGLFISFLDRLKHFRVLDPACGSGNFLNLALLALKDIEHRINIEAELLGLTRQAPAVGPEAVLGVSKLTMMQPNSPACPSGLEKSSG